MSNYPKLVLDFETYYDTKYSLKKLNIMEYVNHPDFTVQGVAVKWLNSVEPSEWISEDDVEEYLTDIDWNNTDIICHHTDFDAYILSQIYKIKPRFHYDTMAMSRGRFPGKLHNLASLVERLFPDDPSIRKGTELIQAKGTKHLTGTLDATIGAYACNDVDITEAAFNQLITDYPESELRIIDMVTRMFTQPRLRLDQQRTVNFRNATKKASDDKIQASTLPREVLSSNDQFADYVTNVLKLDVPMKQGKKKLIPAFGKNDIAFQRLQSDHPEFKHIWDARLATKSRIDVTRSDRFLSGTNSDGTISMPLRYYAAHTGRFGGGEKINPQNLRRGSELRKSLVAPDGYMVVVADKSQIEARLTAWLAGCDELVEAFRNERDVYSEFASEIYNRTVTKDDKIERFVGKTCIARGTLILTERGCVPIEQVKIDDRVWDGIEWVNHKGVVYQGYKDVLTYKGLTATPDHGVFTVNGPIPFGKAAQELAELAITGLDGSPIRISESNLAGYNSPGCAAEHLRVCEMYKLWQREMGQPGKSSSRTNQRMPELFTNQIETLSSAWKTIRRYRGSLQQPIAQEFQKLRGAWDPMQIPIANGIYKMDRKKSTAPDVQESRDRPNQQQRPLRTGQSTLSNAADANSQPKMFKEHVYDIVDAGPRKRYTAANTLILNCILGLGFGVGKVKLQTTLESGSQGPVVIIDIPEATRIVNTYRTKYWQIPALWKKLESAMVWLQDAKFHGRKYGPLVAGHNEWILPNGMSMQYPELQGLSFYDARYKMRKTIWGGVVCENSIQALARVNICEDMLAIEDYILENDLDAMISLQVHDEVICVCREDQAQQLYQAMLKIMATPTRWAPDLPLKAEGGVAKEYSK